MVDGEPDYCPEHTSRVMNRVGRLTVYVALALIFAWFMMGLYTECTSTEPEMCGVQTCDEYFDR